METKILNLHALPSMQPDREKTFLDVFREFNLIDARENGLAKKTFLKYDVFVKNFARYLDEHGWLQLRCDELTIQLTKKFIYWLPDNIKSCGKTHKAKHLDRIRRAADYAVECGFININPLLSYRLKRDKTKPIVNLEDDEFAKWTGAEWQNPVYQKAQHLYIMSSVAGLSYIDLYGYKTAETLLPERFQNSERKKGLWIISQRGKGGRPYFVPLWHPQFRMALDIHQKYDGKLPYMENHFYNRIIREMASILGIDKYLNTHTGRKNCANFLSDIGFSHAEIAAILGNTEKVVATHYASINKKKIENAVARLGA